MEKTDENQENSTEKAVKTTAKKTTQPARETGDDALDASLVYEVSYILLPTLVAEQVDSQVGAIKQAIQSAGGSLIADENPVMIDLAYSMTKVVGTTRHKYISGYFGWIKFDMPKGEVEGVKKAMDNNDTVLRYLIVKTVKENTLLAGKMMLKKEEKKYEEAVPLEDGVVEGAEEAATPEEMDKSIDELVIA